MKVSLWYGFPKWINYDGIQTGPQDGLVKKVIERFPGDVTVGRYYNGRLDLDKLVVNFEGAGPGIVTTIAGTVHDYVFAAQPLFGYPSMWGDVRVMRKIHESGCLEFNVAPLERPVLTPLSKLGLE